MLTTNQTKPVYTPPSTPRKMYTPKQRQMIQSNKLLNAELCDLYEVAETTVGVATFKRMLQDGTIVRDGITYLVTYHEFLPKFLDSGKVLHLRLSYRTPRYVGKDEILEVTKKYSHVLVILKMI